MSTWKANPAGGAGRAADGARALRPTIFVGLGGTGLKVLARYRQRIEERHGDPDFWKIYSFLGIDSDKNDRSKGGVSRQKGSALADRDVVSVSLDSAQVGFVLSELKGAQVHIGQWLHQDASARLNQWNFETGAGQRRAAGRILFVTHIDDIYAQLERRVQDVRSPDAIQHALGNGANLEGGAVDVVIVASLAGGQGCGSFLDCAYLMRAMKMQNHPIGEIRGLFLLPDAFGRSQDIDLELASANGFAAMMELEYYNGAVTRTFSTSSWGGSRARPNGPERDIKGQPLDVCYLFSRETDMPPQSEDEMFDVMADALTFSTAGGTLASTMRSCWANAQGNVYTGSLSSRYYATERGESWEGAPDPLYENRLFYERIWSTRFSSLGIASITLKLPELRRLASVRLLRRVAHLELGEDFPKGKEPKDFFDQCETIVSQVNQQQVFTERLSEKVNERLRGTATAAEVDTAMAALEPTVAHLKSILQSVNSLTDVQNRDAQRLIAHARQTGEETGARLAAGLVGLPLRRSAAVLGRVVEILRKDVEEDLRKDAEAKDADFEVRHESITQWRQIPEEKVGDLLGLGAKAVAIIRRKFAGWGSNLCSDLVRRINAGLSRQYRRACFDALARAGQDVQQGIADVSGWESELRQMQNDLAKQFSDSRNLVLSGDLAASAESNDSGKQQQLDQQADRALARRFGGQPTVEERLQWARRHALNLLDSRCSLGGRAGPTLLAARRETEKRVPRVLEKLVSAMASDGGDGGGMLVHFPDKRDLFEKLQELGKEFSQELPALMNKARAYWSFGPNDEYKRTASTTPLCGATEPVSPTVAYNTAVEQLAQWGRFHPFTEASASSGDLVLVHELHGFALPTLRRINALSAAYQKKLMDPERSPFLHLDYRLRPQLPSLEASSFDQASDEVRCWDVALLGIILGRFRWVEARQAFQFGRAGAAPVDVGPDYEAISRWMRTPEGQANLPHITNGIDRWFTDRIETPHTVIRAEQAARAQQEAARLVLLDLLLDRLGTHVLKPAGPSQMWTPAHTMTIRLRKTRVGSHIQNLVNTWHISEEQLRTTLMPVLHQHVLFTGPKTPSSNGIPRRILRFHYDGESRDQGIQVLNEVFEMGWEPLASLPSEVKSMFPAGVDNPEGLTVPDLPIAVAPPPALPPVDGQIGPIIGPLRSPDAAS